MASPLTVTGTQEPSLACAGLGVRLGGRLVLDDVQLALGPGVTGLLGPNGAGKTTLLDVLATIRRPDTGTAHIGGHDLSSSDGRVRARPLIGYLPQRFDLMRSATLTDNVEFAAWARGLQRELCAPAARRALTTVGLLERRDDRVSRLSGGMRQRVGIACAIVHNPVILLLDEPTSGLDPAQRIELRRFLSDLGRRHAVLLSTHIVSDLEHCASHICVLKRGRVVFRGSPEELAARANSSVDPEETASNLERGYLTVLREA